jgi:hypothetical protein
MQRCSDRGFGQGPAPDWLYPDESDMRRVDPGTEEVLETLEMPRGLAVSGLESDGGDHFSAP